MFRMLVQVCGNEIENVRIYALLDEGLTTHYDEFDCMEKAKEYASDLLQAVLNEPLSEAAIALYLSCISEVIYRCKE